MKVAIVEDEEIFSSAYKKWLDETRPDWIIEAFSDGDEKTIHHLLHGNFDLILLDIVLGSQNPTGGFKVLRRVFEFFGEDGPAVLVLTGTPHIRDVEIMRALAVQEVSSKPDNCSALLRLIDFVMNARRQPEATFREIRLRPFTAFRNCLRGSRGAVSLTQTEICILNALLVASPEVVSSEALKRLLISGDLNAVQQTISNLRAKLTLLYSSEELKERSLLERLATVKKVGYSWQG